MGAALCAETLDGLAAGNIVPEKQDSSQATYAPLLKKDDGLVDWSAPAQAIHDRVRGLQPWPGAYTNFRGQALHIWRSKIPDAHHPGAPGELVSRKPVLVACGSGALELLEVQMEGRKRIPAADFVNGQRLSEGERFGQSS